MNVDTGGAIPGQCASWGVVSIEIELSTFNATSQNAAAL